MCHHKRNVFIVYVLIMYLFRLSRIKYKEEARKLLFKYAEAAKKMIDSRWVTTDQ